MTALVYGPHDPATAPTTILEEVKGVLEPREIPIHPGLIEQRRRINEVAAGTVRRIIDRREG